MKIGTQVKVNRVSGGYVLGTVKRISEELKKVFLTTEASCGFPTSTGQNSTGAWFPAENFRVDGNPSSLSCDLVECRLK